MKQLTILLCVLFPALIFGQGPNNSLIKGVSFQQKDSLIVVRYDLEGKGSYKVTASYSNKEDGPWIAIPLATVKGDLGKVSKGKDKSFTWELLKARNGFSGSMTIKVEATPWVKNTDEESSSNTREISNTSKKPYNITLSALTYGTIVDGNIPSSVDLNSIGGRLGWGRKFGGRLSAIQSSTYNENLATLGVSLAVLKSYSSSWNIYVLGGAALESSTSNPSVTEWLYGAGTDLILGPLVVNFDLLFDPSSNVRAVAGIGWAFKAR